MATIQTLKGLKNFMAVRSRDQAAGRRPWTNSQPAESKGIFELCLHSSNLGFLFVKPQARVID